MEHTLSDTKKLNQSLSSEFESILTDSFKELIYFWLVCFEQILTSDKIKYRCYRSIVKILFLVTMPETRHQEIVVCDEVQESLLDIDEPVF